MSSFRKAANLPRKHTEKDHSLPADTTWGFWRRRKITNYEQNYHAKQDKIRKLRKKALNRNPDEFYFKMVSSRLEDGVHKHLKKEETVTEEQQMMMDTQDKRYVNHKLAVEAKKIEKLRSTLHLVRESEAKPRNKHTFFVDTKQEVQEFDFASHLGTLHSAISPPLDQDDVQAQTLAQEKTKKYRELSQRMNRQKQLKIIADKMDSRKNKKDKRRKVLIKEETKTSPAVYKFYPERKR